MADTKRVRLTVAYDGTNYHGWQIQDNGITIESELNRCLSDLFKEDIHFPFFTFCWDLEGRAILLLCFLFLN